MKKKMNKGFTLIELLVVVAIIGILAAMILPALGKARQKAKLAKCKSRLKQVGTTVAMYYTDGTTSALATSTDHETTPDPFDVVDTANAAYIYDVDDSIVTCPVVDETDTANIYAWVFDGANESYTGDTDSALASDASGQHPQGLTEQTVYQDGHVQ